MPHTQPDLFSSLSPALPVVGSNAASSPAPAPAPAPAAPAPARVREAESRLVVATDGSCLGNPGPGGWCWFVSPQCWQAGAETATTNNRMELLSVMRVLEACEPTRALHIVADSRYVLDALTRWRFGWSRRGWRTAKGEPVSNRDLIEPLGAVLDARRVTFEWVRGHVGHPLNEAADLRARAAAEAVGAGRAPRSGPGFASVPSSL